MQRTRIPLLLAAAVSLSLAASGCATSSGGSAGSSRTGDASTSAATAPSSSEGSAAPSASASATADSAFAVPGYAVGEIPPVPLFALPNLSLLSASTGAFTPEVTSTIASVPGVTVSPARCDEPGVLASDSAFTVVTGDGGVVTSNGDSSGVNDGDGATGVSITNSGNGEGTYTDAHLSVTVDGKGAGTYTDSRTGETITINSDGSGTYTVGDVSITNDGKGAGSYTDTATGLSIVNDGTGTALVTSASGSRSVSAEALPKVDKVGSFPPIDAARPVESCGTVISLQDGVLFDFGSSQVRPEAAQTLGNLADVLNRAGASSGHVYGHTDSVSDESFNQTLSEQRAQAVADALTAAGATASLDVTGYGESRPVAPNENPDGSDNPAGRRLNRRVEVFVPAS